MAGSSGWSRDLGLALARSSVRERVMSLVRGHVWNKNYKMGDAILIAANACERCMNSLAHQYGLSWGYKEHSNEWCEAGTSCNFCVDN